MKSFASVVFAIVCIVGCSNIEHKLYGMWYGDTFNIDFYSDSTGNIYYMDSSGYYTGTEKKSLRFKWKLLKDNRIKIETEEDVITGKMVDNQLYINGYKLTNKVKN